MKAWIRCGGGIAILLCSLGLGCGSKGSTPPFNGEGGPTPGRPEEGVRPDGSGGGPILCDHSGVDIQDSCISLTGKPEPIPINLVMAVDVSDSMFFQSGSSSNTYDSISKVLEKFFSDPASKGFKVSLLLFPTGGNPCSESTYEQPTVSLTPLPSTNLASAIANEAKKQHNNGSCTPTAPVTVQAIQMVNSIQARTSEKTFFVLVTDGEPAGCKGKTYPEEGSTFNYNTTDGVALLLRDGLKKGVKTYVIGLGQVENIDRMASEGGTQNAFTVNVNNPEQAATDFANALAQIQQFAVKGEYVLPEPPPGKSFVADEINVRYTPSPKSGGKPFYLCYSADLKVADDVWAFDNPDNPTKVLLGDQIQDKMIKDPNSVVDIIQGCKTNSPIAR
ncbi:vWA domain-containing protein [Pajaroellobacter abortibovis]|uniref:VWFA domain-containing protein n=1 Tax=Pajaroellobacter abortibovis TaxID=1882918 RepID=A0A1L6MUV2_9BACT|nr:vWA domain-containing protein [Pajaroellobacter abortibovis]APR99289.1 hypothetical protein BCY86_00320 [Pajaroellobacter abortibovis]